MTPGAATRAFPGAGAAAAAATGPTAAAVAAAAASASAAAAAASAGDAAAAAAAAVQTMREPLESPPAGLPTLHQSSSGSEDEGFGHSYHGRDYEIIMKRLHLSLIHI